MQFTVDKRSLAHLLKAVNSIPPARPSHPILACFLLEVADSTLTVSAFDLAIGLKMSMPVFMLAKGKVCIPAASFTKMVSALPDGNIEFVLEEEQLKMSAGRSFRTLATLSADEFPNLPVVNDETSIALTAEALKSASGVMFAMSSEESKRILNGVNVRATADGLKFAATDGHRLAVVSIPDTKYETNIEVTIPGKAFKELVSLSAGNDVQFSFDQGQAAFKAEGWELFSRTLDGSYPNYPQLIPNMFGRIITVERDEAIEVFARIDSVVDSKVPVIKLAIEAETIVFHAEQAQVSNGTETIDCSLVGEPILFGFNAKYLAEAIKFTSSRTICIKANTPTTPVIFQNADSDDCLALLMPIQIRV